MNKALQMFLSFIFMLWMFMYPNLIYQVIEYPILRYLVKFPLIIVLFLIFFYFGLKEWKRFIFPSIVMLLLIVDLIIIEGSILKPHRQYFYSTLIFLFGAATFFKYPVLIKIVLQVHVLIAVLLSIQTVLFFILHYYFIELSGIMSNVDFSLLADYGSKDLKFNFLWGVVPYYGESLFGITDEFIRYGSFFSEPPRFSYFLTIPFFTLISLRKISFHYLIMFSLIVFGSIAASSIYFAITAFLSYLLLILYRLKRYQKKKYKFVILLSILLVFAVGNLPAVKDTIQDSRLGLKDYSEVIHTTTRGKSLRDRVNSLFDTITLLNDSPFGRPESKGLAGLNLLVGSTFTAPFYYAVFGGIQGLILCLILIMLILNRIWIIYRYNINPFVMSIVCGIFAYFTQQIFLGTLFGYLWIIYAAILFALAELYSVYNKEFIDKIFQPNLISIHKTI